MEYFLCKIRLTILCSKQMQFFVRLLCKDQQDTADNVGIQLESSPLCHAHSLAD